MTDTTFQAGTIVEAAWLNDVNNLRYGAGNSARGAALLQHVPRGTGAVATTTQRKAQYRIDAFDFMTAAQIVDVEAGTLTLDVSAALNAFFAAVVASRGRGRGHLNGGMYRCNSILTPITTGYLDIEGEGKYGSVLVNYASSGSLLKFSGSSLPLCAISKMGFLQAVSTTGQLLETSGVFRFDINNVFLNGGAALAAGLALLSGTSVYASNLEGIGFTDFGLKLVGGNDYFISNGTIQANGVVGNPLWIQDVTGGAVQIVAMNFLEGANCRINNSNFISILGSYFDSAQGAVSVSGCEQVYFDAGCEFANRVTTGSGNGGGVIFGNSKSCGVYNSMVINCGGSGITINANTENIEVVGNNITSNNTANTAGVVAGVNVGGGAQSFKILGNTIGNNTALWTGYQRQGIAVNVGASDNYIIADNDVRNNVTTGIDDNGTGTAAQVRGNVGYNPIGLSVVAPPATTVTYRAGHTPETVYLTGGTVSAVKIPDNAGSTIFATTPCTLQLEPNETFSITYTVAPTMSKQRH